MTEEMTTLAKPAAVSAVILTKNEELNLGCCLSSLQGWAGKVFVVDSGSTDATLEICRTFGAEVFFHEFETHSRQWQWALATLPIDTEWVIGLDADQRVTPELRAEIVEFIHGPAGADPSIHGAYVNRRQIFRGKWIRHGGYYPKHLLKLFRTGTAFSDADDMVDHHFRLNGKTVKLRHDLIEDNENERDISTWIAKHNRYAGLQALEEFKKETGLGHAGSAGRVFGSPDERTLWLKSLWAQCPLYLRPILYFTYRYFFRLGFLDGKRGFIFHFLQAFWYRLLVDIHLDELRHGATSQAVGQPAGQLAAAVRSRQAPE
jgi:glycosyltransferase involved in cell wall biosynthesis